MRETVILTGMVLISAPSGILRQEAGAAFTRERDAYSRLPMRQKPGNPPMASSRPFSFGTFTLRKEGVMPITFQSSQITIILTGCH